jgi:hypothetical protein
MRRLDMMFNECIIVITSNMPVSHCHSKWPSHGTRFLNLLLALKLRLLMTENWKYGRQVDPQWHAIHTNFCDKRLISCNIIAVRGHRLKPHPLFLYKIILCKTSGKVLSVSWKVLLNRSLVMYKSAHIKQKIVYDYVWVLFYYMCYGMSFPRGSSFRILTRATLLF